VSDLWTIRRIAREYDIAPSHAHRWTREEWFPKPQPGGMYDPAEVRAAVLRRRRQRSSRNARMVRAYRAHSSIEAAAKAGKVHRNTASRVLREIGEIE
jgi:transposase-like protein